MSSDASTAAGASLTGELLSGQVYKPNQGRLVRQMTALAIWVVVAMASWSLYGTLGGYIGKSYPRAVWIVPALTLLGGLWFGYRVVNWPRFADFLIAVEAELNKVTWPTKDELKRASVVVMLTILILASLLFFADVVWKLVFDTIGVTG